MRSIFDFANSILSGAFVPYLTPFSSPLYGGFSGFRPSWGFGRSLNRGLDRWWEC
jgi:hypothetical protein